ncbi:MAG: hypothetical protein V7637_561 [Mycobacteriales bacterium]
MTRTPRRRPAAPAVPLVPSRVLPAPPAKPPAGVVAVWAGVVAAVRVGVGVAVRAVRPSGGLAVALAAVGLFAAGCGSAAPPAAAPVAQQQHPLPSSAAGGLAGAGGAPAATGRTGAATGAAGSTGTVGEPGTGGGGGAVPGGDRGFRLNVPLPRARFALTDTTGARYDFTARTRGRATLLYFGYTHCPDQCPTMLADIAAALRQLPAAVRSRVTVVFVTTDPQRDTPAVLAHFLAQFDPAFIGLTGDTAAVVRAQQAAQIPLSKPTPETTKAPAGSTAHGGGALAYGLDDYAHLTYPAGTSVEDLVHDLPALVTGTGGHA